MKFYSDITNKVYDTEKELLEAEEQVAINNKKDEEAKKIRAERAKEIENAFTELHNAQDKVDKLIEDFVKDYGSYHTSLRSENLPLHTSLLDMLLNWW